MLIDSSIVLIFNSLKVAELSNVGTIEQNCALDINFLFSDNYIQTPQVCSADACNEYSVQKTTISTSIDIKTALTASNSTKTTKYFIATLPRGNITLMLNFNLTLDGTQTKPSGNYTLTPDMTNSITNYSKTSKSLMETYILFIIFFTFCQMFY